MHEYGSGLANGKKIFLAPCLDDECSWIDAGTGNSYVDDERRQISWCKDSSLRLDDEGSFVIDRETKSDSIRLRTYFGNMNQRWLVQNYLLGSGNSRKYGNENSK